MVTGIPDVDRSPIGAKLNKRGREKDNYNRYRWAPWKPNTKMVGKIQFIFSIKKYFFIKKKVQII